MARRRATPPKLVQLRSEPKPPPELELIEELVSQRDALDRKIQALRQLVETRDQAREQVCAMRELAERSMARAEALEGRLEEASATLAEGEAALTRARGESTQTQTELARRAQRIGQLEATLAMLAEADGKG